MQQLARTLTSEEVKEQLPINEWLKNDILSWKKEINDILHWVSQKKLLIIWPCSMDFPETIIEYAHRLSDLKKRVWDKIFIVMRTYTSKPRTTVGWKWMIFWGEFWTDWNINDWILTSRKLMINIAKLGLPVADEMLYPDLINRFDDILSYIAIGARSSENQHHREVASGLNIPVWIKNPTSWDYNVTVNSLKAVRSSQDVLMDWIHFHSFGNQNAHIILRGSNLNWVSSPNISDEVISTIDQIMNKSWISSKYVIDLNHENSWKNWLKQHENLKTALNLNNSNRVAWFMVESYLKDWNQKAEWVELNNIEKWKSITDHCVGWEGTEELVETLYQYLQDDLEIAA